MRMRQWLFLTLIFLCVASLATPQEPERVRVLIGFHNLPTQADEKIITDVGGNVIYRYHLVNAMAIEVPETAIPGLSQNPNVSVIEPDGVVEISDSELDNAWGVKHLGAGTIHDLGIKGAGVTVAVVDTGIDYTHPDLDANYVSGYDFVNNDPDPMDGHSHGTHVSGTIAGEDDDSGVVGMAPEAFLYGVKVLNDSGSGSWSNVIAGIEWTVDNGIQVTNNSYGGSGDPGTIVKAAFDNSYAAGVLHIASAGNSGNCDGTGETMKWPAKYASVVAIAATDPNNNRACFSSTGVGLELSAPGVSVYSTTLNGSYGFKSGTSMASPHVAGAAALVISSGSATTNTEVRDRLLSTATDIGPPGFDTNYGHGLVNPVAAIDPNPTNPEPVITINSPLDGSVFLPGTSVPFSGTAIDDPDGDLTSIMTWSSSIDGAIGTGGSFSFILSQGEHTIVASATDLEGKTGISSVVVTVQILPTTVGVTSIGYKTKGGRFQDKHITVTLIVKDDLNGVVPGATVTMTLVTGSNSWQFTGTTDEFSRVKFRVNNSPAGCYQSTVDNVVASGLTWDGRTPDNIFCK